jgi:glycosyltransferase involved in cell wall biosynthesis
MPAPKISIVTPSFNQGAFLERTILSVLEQDYPNIEYIIIDGGSTDNSVEIIKKYSDRLAYWISEPDNGQSDAINKGFKIAAGDYVGWINSDDFYTDGAISNLVNNIDDNAVLYYGILGYCREDGSHRMLETVDERITAESILNGKSCTSQPGSFYKKEVLQKVGYLDEKLNFVMDTDLWLKLLACGVAKFVPHVMAYLRAHDASKSCNKKIADIRESQQIHIKHGGSYFSRHYIRGLYAIYTNVFTKKYK